MTIRTIKTMHLSLAAAAFVAGLLLGTSPVRAQEGSDDTPVVVIDPLPPTPTCVPGSGSDDILVTCDDPVSVPEPGTLPLFAMGLAVWWLVRRKARKTA